MAIPGFENGGYGLGWGVVVSDGETQLRHDGGTLGFRSYLLAVPASDWGVVILANRGRATAFLDAVTRYVTAIPYGRERVPDDDLLAVEHELRAADDRIFAASVPVSADAAAAYLGTYTDDVRVRQHRDDIIIGSVYGDLQFRANPDKTGVFVGVDAISIGMVAEFTLTTTGAMRLRLAYSDPLGEVSVERRRKDPDPGVRRGAGR